MMVHFNGRLLRLLLVAVAVVVVVLTFLVRCPVPEPSVSPQPQLTRELRASCRLLTRPDDTLQASSVTREALAWACSRVGVLLPWPRPVGCGRSVTYAPADTLEQNLLRYAVLFGFLRLLHADALVEPRALTALRSVFPSLTLPPLPPLAAEHWQPTAFWPSLELVRCRPGERSLTSEPQRYLVSGPPDGSAVHLFQPFESELRSELRFSSTLRQRAQSVLLAARGRRDSITFIGLLLPKPNDARRPVSENYLRHSLDHYRRRFDDALFLLVTPNARAWSSLMLRGDVVTVEATVARDEALSLAVRAACNHSIVAGDDGFWGAYLADGDVTVPQPEPSDAAGFGWLSLYSQITTDKRWTIVK